MLGPTDYEALARTLSGNVTDDWNEAEVPKDYDINTLDYAFVRSCKSIKELKKVLAVLRSHKEGYYPELEKATEDRIVSLGGKLSSRPSLVVPSSETVKDIQDELGSWLKEISEKDRALRTRPTQLSRSTDTSATITEKEGSNAHQTRPSESITIKSVKKPGNIESSQPQKISSQKSNRIKSSNYREWDKFNVEAELEKIDKEDVLPKRDAVRLNNRDDIKINMEIPKDETLSELDIQRTAEEDRVKGNEAFKAGDYEEAVQYYTRSIKLHPRANLYTNRSLAYLKLLKYEAAEADATESLKLNDSKYRYKGYLRRAVARYRRGKYYEAMNDFEDGGKLELDEKERKELEGWRTECEKKWMKVDEVAAKRWKTRGMRKMNILEGRDEKVEQKKQDYERSAAGASRDSSTSSHQMSDKITSNENIGNPSSGAIPEAPSKPKITIAEVTSEKEEEDDPFAEECHEDTTTDMSNTEHQIQSTSDSHLPEVKSDINQFNGQTGTATCSLKETPSLQTQSQPISPLALDCPKLPIPSTSYELESTHKAYANNSTHPSWVNLIYDIPVTLFVRLLNNLNTTSPISGIIIALFEGIKTNGSPQQLKKCLEILQAVSKSKRFSLAVTFFDDFDKKNLNQLFEMLRVAPIYRENSGMQDVIKKLEAAYLK